MTNYLEIFRKNFPLTKVNVYDTYICYSVDYGRGKSSAILAEQKIKELSLPLRTEVTSLKGLGSDTFIVFSSRYSDVGELLNELVETKI